MRYGKFGHVEVLGTEFWDSLGMRCWAFAFWSESNPSVRVCFASRGEVPEYINSADWESLQQAKINWEASPEALPN